ncbi:MAG TPA: ATPase, T2SS/T4P/T4SS family, partial [Candidatus Hydrogenedentes bacterium]|nr:ATPase, T2SS/T4P/T4SS family [Candidatus Hydrogenedentota bacterium]
GCEHGVCGACTVQIDGVLHDIMSIPQNTELAVISRIKILADLDITETRHPQDGHISMEVAGRAFDVRVATLPTFLGERVVLRLLDQTSILSGIKDLGLESDDEKKLTGLINQPYGMILVTGPTGSGKTTTLYAALNQKNVLTDSIVTLEDPVEYQLSGINQVQIDTHFGITFAATLRAAMRQDIDVLLVGEIRDAETAHIAIRAAMTGHLVFSTLHTNDAPEAISTLRNMGVPSYLICGALSAVVAQRLVRKICENCRQPFKPTPETLRAIGLPATVKKLYGGKGCAACYHTGNHGRTGIFEILEITGDIRHSIASEAGTHEIAKQAKLVTMAERCRQKVRSGIVEPKEYLRVIRQ